MALDIDTVFRDNVIKGDIHSGAHDPDKAEIRALLKTLTGSSSAPAVVKQTKAALDAVSPTSENYGGLVLNDPDATKNGYYYREAAAWVKGRGFPDTFAVLTSIGGTANAITASTEAGVDPADVLCVMLPDPPGTNSSATVTLTLNGGSAESVKAASGASLAVGDIIDGVGTLFFKVGSEWRQLFSSATGATFDHQGDYAAPTTYTEGQVVTGSDGKWYQLKNPSATGDDPVVSVTGAWLEILAAGGVADGAVTTVKLADAAVTTAKLADDAVTLEKVADAHIIGVTGADFGMVSDLGTTNTDNNAALQAAIDYCVTNRQTLWLFGNYRVVGEIEITGPVSIVLADGAELNFSSLGLNKAAFTLTHTTGRVVFDGSGTLSGPTTGSYVAGERAIQCLGTSTSVRKSGITVRGIEIKNFGSEAIYCQFVDKITIERARLHHIGYAAAQFLSCDDGEFIYNHVYTIGPGASSNMYGLAITHDSTGYSSDPDVGTKLATNPFSRGWYVAFNEVEDIDWEGLDCHGAYEVQMVHNRIYATKYGIALPSSSGDAAAYAGYQNICAHNVIDGRNKDGTVSGRENTGYGINLNGGSTVNHLRVVCEGNIIRNKGIPSSSSSAAIQALYCANAVISNNIIDNWASAGIYAGAAGGKIAGNLFGPCATAWTDNACIREDVGTQRRLSVTDNALDPRGGTAANYGLRQQGATAFDVTSAGNDFRAATTSAVSVQSGTTYAGV